MPNSDDTRCPHCGMRVDGLYGIIELFRDWGRFIVCRQSAASVQQPADP